MQKTMLREDDPAAQVPQCARKRDPELVDRAVVEIKAILSHTVARGIDEVGQYLLRVFYDDDPSLYNSASHHKHASLRMLEERCESLDLPVRRTFLGNALQLAVFSREISKRSPFLLLPPSHRIELLRLRSQDRVERFARRAVDTNMTVQRIREIVRKERERTKSSRGRRPTPTVIKTLTSCVGLLRNETTGRLSLRVSDVKNLSDEEISEARALAEILARRVEEAQRLLG